jgi:hypothetical protein
MVANELGAFTPSDPYQFIFFVEMPGLIKVLTIPLIV